MVPGLTVGPEIGYGGHHDGEEGREELLQVIAEVEVLLPWLSDDRRGAHRALFPEKTAAAEDRVVVLERVVPVVIAERALRAHLVRIYFTDEGELAVRDD